jgi:hypothetical protein
MSFHLIIAALFCVSLGAVNGSVSKMRRSTRKYVRSGSQFEFGRTIDPREVETEAEAEAEAGEEATAV